MTAAAAGALAVSLAASGAWAQVADPVNEDQDETQLDDIIVTATGTNIAGVKPVGSQTVTLSREDIMSSGVSNVADAVRTLPQVRNLGDFREGGTQGSYNSQQGNAINLRGLGAQATLTLVDGHRLVATGAASNFTEANQVPLAAVERIEVIADGASALYGSDAVAGVVNYVLRKDFDGVEASVRVTNQTGGMEYTPAITTGKAWSDLGGLGGGNVLLAYEYTSRDGYLRSKNPLLMQDLTAFGGPDNRLNGTTATVSGPANIYVQNADGSQNTTLPRAGAFTYYGLPNGSNVGLSASALLLNKPNLTDTGYYTDYVGESKRHQVSLFANQQFGQHIEGFLQASYNKRDTYSRSAATLTRNVTLSPVLFDAAGNPTATPNPYYIAGVPGVAPGAPLNVQYGAFKDIGSSNFDNYSETYSVTAGFRAMLPFNWKMDASYTYARDEACNYCQTRLNLNPTALQYRINTGEINPLSSDPLTSAQLAMLLGDNIQSSGNGLDDLVVKFNGPVFELPGGMMRAAFGGEYNTSYNYNVNGANRTALNGFEYDTTEATSKLDRSITSVFGELYVPLIGAGMNVPLVQGLILDAAIRYDDYSDVGSTTNPKIGVTWDVNDVLSLRGSWGTSFRAPSLPDVNLFAFSASAGFPSSNSDPRVKNGFLDLPGAGLTLANVGLILGSNTDLKPEEATNWSLGADLDLGSLKLSLSYYNIAYTGRIAQPDALAAYQAGLYPDYRGFAPNIIPINNPATCSNSNLSTADPVLQAYLGRTVLYGGIPDYCAVNVLIDQRNTNLAATRQDGLDASAFYTRDVGEVKMNASLAVSWTMSNDQQVAEGQPFEDRLGFYSTPIEWRGRASVGAAWQDYSANLFINYTGGYTNDLAVNAMGVSIPPQKVDAWITSDLTLAYATAFATPAAGFVKGFRASLTVQNLTDEDPHYVITSQGAFNGAYSHPYGRTFSAQLTASF
ncbi:MAG: TonB-dependent receptor [Candidatus Brevundimonas colombiensis]|uniref:TonB-dependent receptor n=1 Tax=Candidatus Brevundimonas colombiensis TaxID=3121376 RepID=A0AAJ5X6S0_9CAUL|nr:TonB-dependent receptor [Brevundimonas sp.]WEK41460.1 MAG: TonB-dependent receptor [Brevundimonas sp.]